MTPDIRRIRPCETFVGVNRCRVCLWNKHFHQPRFQDPTYIVWCSACGGEFKRRRNEGYSHCSDHQQGGR